MKVSRTDEKRRNGTKNKILLSSGMLPKLRRNMPLPSSGKKSNN
jgi:hypothetical protein